MARKPADIEAQLRRAIQEADVNCCQLSKLTGVSRGVLSHFMNHNRSLTLPTAAKLCKALGLELRPTQKGKG